MEKALTCLSYAWNESGNRKQPDLWDNLASKIFVLAFGKIYSQHVLQKQIEDRVSDSCSIFLGGNFKIILGCS